MVTGSLKPPGSRSSAGLITRPTAEAHLLKLQGI